MTTEYDAFATTYDLEMGWFALDLDFYVSLAKEAAPPVLELAAGTGRVTIPIAEAGVPVVGVDSSVEMLRVAREKIVGRDLPVTWVEGDMRDFRLDERFGLCIIPFRAFLHLLTPEDHLTCLQRIHNHLIPGGLLALNFFVPSIPIIAAHLEQLGSALLTARSSWRDEKTGGEVLRWDYRSYEPHLQRIHQRFVYQWLDADGNVVRAQHKQYTLCYIWPNEFRHLLARAGFKVLALYGGFDGQPFGASSMEQIWVARKVEA